jgi:hypothetical protein
MVPVCTLLGNQAITGTGVAPHELFAPLQDQRVLRELTLSITWDDDVISKVLALLGDFYYGSMPLAERVGYEIEPSGAG